MKNFYFILFITLFLFGCSNQNILNNDSNYTFYGGYDDFENFGNELGEDQEQNLNDEMYYQGSYIKDPVNQKVRELLDMQPSLDYMMHYALISQNSYEDELLREEKAVYKKGQNLRVSSYYKHSQNDVIEYLEESRTITLGEEYYVCRKLGPEMVEWKCEKKDKPINSFEEIYNKYGTNDAYLKLGITYPDSTFSMVKFIDLGDSNLNGLVVHCYETNEGTFYLCFSQEGVLLNYKVTQNKPYLDGGYYEREILEYSPIVSDDAFIIPSIPN